MTDSDGQLLRDFARDGADEVFRQLVERHVDLVYSTALRSLAGDHALAEDVTQAVFSDLAGKAARLPEGTVLSGWLYQAARFAAAKAVRAEQRRRARETAAGENQMNAPEPEPAWDQLRPLLDEAMDSLPAPDRDAVLLRFFERQELTAVGSALGLSDEAARKRISRALDRMREQLALRGIRTTSGALGAVIAAHAVHAAPAGLAATVAAASLVAGVGAAAGGFFSLKLLPTIAMTKTTAVVSAALVAAGVATPLLWQHRQLDALRTENAALHAQLSQTPEPAPADPAATQAEEARLRGDKEELLRLRGEVTRLRRDQAALAQTQGASAGKARADTRAKPAVPPASQPGYVPAGQYAFAGYATPQAALQSFFWAMENPRSGKLIESLALPENVRQLVPQGQPLDFAISAKPAVVEAESFSVSPEGEKVVTRLPDDGSPLGLSKGYRVTAETDLPDGRKQLAVERELPDGTVRNETHTLAKQGEEWKIQPGTGMQVMAVHDDGKGVLIDGGAPADGNGPAAVQGFEVRLDGNPPAPAP